MELKRKIIARKHPHYGEIGTLDMDDFIPATDQMRLKLENCKHGTAGCYVTKYEVVAA